MSSIVDGRAIARHILDRLQKKISLSRKAPHLAVVLVGNDEASQTYVRKKQEAAIAIGLKFTLYRFPAQIKTKQLVAELQKIQNQNLSGIIVQLPLPKGIEKRQVLNAIHPNLDVDFLSWESLGKLVIGENELIPPSPGAILEILKYYRIPLKAQHIVLVGGGDLIGKPFANLLLQLPVTLTVCNKETKNLAAVTRQADILITGTGVAELIKGNMVRNGVIAIDAGVSFKGKKMFGDLKFDEVAQKAALITPTPGGVGPITVAKLLENTVNNVSHG